jgi:hypothetical protein
MIGRRTMAAGRSSNSHFDMGPRQFFRKVEYIRISGLADGPAQQ